MKRQLYYLMPGWLRPALRRIYYFPLDVYEKTIGKRPAGVPPRGMVFVGYGDYTEVGNRYLKHFIELGNLQPDHKVLDIGCGIGRMALPLTTYLSDKGSYEGFDIVKSGIDWCNRHIRKDFPNFNFLYTGLYNQLYNTRSDQDAGHFRFPFPDTTFDFVFLTSVFTHMMPAEVENYISEISRVMKPGSRCFASIFLLNPESEQLLATNPTHMTFPVDKGFYRLHSSAVDTANVAYQESWVREKASANGLSVRSVHYGQWCNRKEYFDYQDILILTRNENL